MNLQTIAKIAKLDEIINHANRLGCTLAANLFEIDQYKLIIADMED